jgi:hypothetical protein
LELSARKSPQGAKNKSAISAAYKPDPQNLRIISVLPIRISQKVYTAQFGQTQFLPQTNGTRFEPYEIDYSGNEEQIRLDLLTGAQKSGILD